MSDAPQERARAVVKSYIALHDALRNALSAVPLTDHGELTTVKHLGTKIEYSIYSNLSERFMEHAKTDAYWRLIDIATGGQND